MHTFNSHPVVATPVTLTDFSVKTDLAFNCCKASLHDSIGYVWPTSSACAEGGDEVS